MNHFSNAINEDSVIRIDIPTKLQNEKFTVFAEGVSYGAFLNPEKGLYEVYLDYSQPILLYFTLVKSRRLYICTNPENSSTEIVKFPVANKPLSVMATLRGRAFDRFKRSLKYIKKVLKTDCTRYNIKFYWELAYLSNTGLTAAANLKALVEKYKLMEQIEKIYSQGNSATVR